MNSTAIATRIGSSLCGEFRTRVGLRLLSSTRPPFGELFFRDTEDEPMTRSLVRAATVAAATLFATGTATAHDYWVYFGTYTGKDGSQGIYRSKLDGHTGKLTAPELAAEMGSPSFVTIHPNNKFLYAVGEGG